MTAARLTDEARATVARRMRASEDISARVLGAINSLPLDDLREVARLYVDETGYLGDHLPGERENVAPFACSGETYHFCSFSTQHDPGCLAAGGDGKMTGRFKNAHSCAADCGETDAEPWCHCSGFGCATCEMVDKLLGLLEANGA